MHVPASEAFEGVTVVVSLQQEREILQQEMSRAGVRLDQAEQHFQNRKVRHCHFVVDKYL